MQHGKMEVGEVAAPPSVEVTVHKDPNAGDPRSGKIDPRIEAVWSLE
jgi:hypothetical protein